MVTVADQADVLPVLSDRFRIRPRAGWADPSPDLLTMCRHDEATGRVNVFAYSYKFYLAAGAAPRETTLVVEGEGTPYVLDDWTGSVAEASDWWARDGYTSVPVSLAPGETLRLVLDRQDASGEGGGTGAVTGRRSEQRVAWKLDLPVRDITVEDWNEGGEKVIVTETKLGHETREAHYTTRKTRLTFESSRLTRGRTSRRPGSSS